VQQTLKETIPRLCQFFLLYTERAQNRIYLFIYLQHVLL
jgi:hypothetical protein